MTQYSGPTRAGIKERCPDCNKRYPAPACMSHTLDECLANIADVRRTLT